MGPYSYTTVSVATQFLLKAEFCILFKIHTQLNWLENRSGCSDVEVEIYANVSKRRCHRTTGSVLGPSFSTVPWRNLSSEPDAQGVPLVLKGRLQHSCVT